jgi:hypothetical protein
MTVESIGKAEEFESRMKESFLKVGGSAEF